MGLNCDNRFIETIDFKIFRELKSRNFNFIILGIHNWNNNLFAWTMTFIQLFDRRYTCKSNHRRGIPLFFHMKFLAARHYCEKNYDKNCTCDSDRRYYRVFLPLRPVQQVTWPALLPAFLDSSILDDNYPIHWGRNVLTISHIRLGAIALWLALVIANRIALL